MATVQRSKVRIVEDLPEGWLVFWTEHTPDWYSTATEALHAVKDRDQATVNGGQPAVVTTIEWEPKTAVGIVVARVVAGVHP